MTPYPNSMDPPKMESGVFILEIDRYDRSAFMMTELFIGMAERVTEWPRWTVCRALKPI